MKTICLVSSLLFASVSFSQKNTFVVEGYLPQAASGTKVYLGYKKEGQRLLDSAAIVDGRFTFSGAIDKGEFLFASLVADHQKEGINKLQQTREIPDMRKLILPEGTVTISGTDLIKNAVLKDVANLNEENNQLNSLLEQTRGQDKQAERKERLELFIKERPASLISLEAVRIMAGPVPDTDKGLALFETLAPEVREGKAGMELLRFFLNNRSVTEKAMAPDFQLPDESGNLVQLSSFRGKYILLDFWASWCGPCREQSPQLRKIHNRYKEKGFDIVAVSLDREPNAWLQAIKKDKLTWTHLSDLQHRYNKAAILYGIDAIPQNVLIDPYGKIIAKDLALPNLNRLLKELLK